LTGNPRIFKKSFVKRTRNESQIQFGYSKCGHAVHLLACVSSVAELKPTME